MKETVFLKRNVERWKQIEAMFAQESQIEPDLLAKLFIELTDDLSYSKTFYPKSKTTKYLNGLTSMIHLDIYKNKKEKSNRIIEFWKTELPLIMWQCRLQLLYAFLFFTVSVAIGSVSQYHDDSFVRAIIGDGYVNQTMENIKKGDPFAVYGTTSELGMSLRITLNNIRVAANTFIGGILALIGTVYIIFFNGIMVGSFFTMFYQHGQIGEAILTVLIHGAIELSVIVIAGCAGFTLGNSILFPKTLPRLKSFINGAKKGIKIFIGIVPLFILAGFIEGFITRHYLSLPQLLKGLMLFASMGFIIWYFVLYPFIVKRRVDDNAKKLMNIQL